MSRGKRITNQEMEYIKVHTQDMTISEIATALGRNYWAVQRLIQNKDAGNLTNEQKRKIDELKGEKSVNQIARQLGVSYIAVNGYLTKRVNATKNHMFTADEDFLIRKLYPSYRVSYIATQLKVTEEQVYNRARKLGIRKNRSNKV